MYYEKKQTKKYSVYNHFTTPANLNQLRKCWSQRYAGHDLPKSSYTAHRSHGSNQRFVEAKDRCVLFTTLVTKDAERLRQREKNF